MHNSKLTASKLCKDQVEYLDRKNFDSSTLSNLFYLGIGAITFFGAELIPFTDSIIKAITLTSMIFCIWILGTTVQEYYRYRSIDRFRLLQKIIILGGFGFSALIYSLYCHFFI